MFATVFHWKLCIYIYIFIIYIQYILYNCILMYINLYNLIYIRILYIYIHSTLQKKLLFLSSFQSLREVMGRAQLASVVPLLVTPIQVSLFIQIYIDTFVIQYIRANFHKKHVKVYVLANSPRIFSNEQWFKNKRYSTVSISVYSTFTSFKHH